MVLYRFAHVGGADFFAAGKVGDGAGCFYAAGSEARRKTVTVDGGI